MEVKTKTKPRYRVNLDDVPKRRARPTTTPNGESLLAKDETLSEDKIARNARVIMDPDEVKRIEARAIAEEEASRAGH